MDEMWIRVQREVKANAKKAALLGALLLFGCCIWVPMLMRAIAPARPAVAKSGSSSSTAKSPEMPNVANSSPIEASAKPGEFWSKLAATLADDPMFQTADVQSISRNPFQIVEVPEPLPVLFAAEPEPQTTVNIDEDAKRLELRSTIIGRTRRAAMINGQLYQLGRKIQMDGRQYLLTRIESNRVVLSSAEQTIELKLARPLLEDVINRNEASGPPLQ